MPESKCTNRATPPRDTVSDEARVRDPTDRSRPQHLTAVMLSAGEAPAQLQLLASGLVRPGWTPVGGVRRGQKPPSSGLVQAFRPGRTSRAAPGRMRRATTHPRDICVSTPTESRDTSL